MTTTHLFGRVGKSRFVTALTSSAVLATTFLALAVASSDPASAVTVVAKDKLVATIGTSAVSVSVTNTTRELAIAWVSADATASGQTVTVSGGGLTWHLAGRSNARPGDAEAWYTTTNGAAFTVTATPAQLGVSTQLTVITYIGATRIGAVKAGAAISGAPTVSLTPVGTGSLVGGVGMDFDHATLRTLASGQAMDRQDTDAAGDTYWVQHATAATTAGSAVPIADTAPTTDQWNLLAVEAAAPATVTPTPKPTATTVPTPPATFPNATNTGPAAAGFTNLTPYTGPDTITTPGTVISGKIITNQLLIKAANVTIQGNLIKVTSDYAAWRLINVYGVNGVRILDNEIRGNGNTLTTSAQAGISLTGDNVTFSRNNVYWIADDGVTFSGNNMTLSDNWIHDFVSRDTVHYDAILQPAGNTSSPSSDTDLIQHNSVDLWVFAGGGGGMNGALTLPNPAPNFTINNNWFAGGSYTVGGGGLFENNIFSKIHAPLCGESGDQYPASTPVRWINNKYDDGTPA